VIRLVAMTNLHQRDIAFLAGVSQAQVSRWMRDPAFKHDVEIFKRRVPIASDDDDDDDWSIISTTYKS
jgi:hypothetical protein